MSADVSELEAGFQSAARLNRDRVGQRLAGNITPLVWGETGRCDSCGYSGPILRHIIAATPRRMCGPCTSRHVWGRTP